MSQFPASLQEVALIRLLASIGAGGVIYMTPLIFNAESLSATEVGLGLSLAALTGILSRLICGLLLDRGVTCSWPVRAAALLAISGDLVLFHADSFSVYLQGQMMLGMAAGLYWPAIELSVPLSCEGFPSSQGYALVRTADAMGIGLGAIAGSITAAMGVIRWVYPLELICMTLLLALLIARPLPDARASMLQMETESHSNAAAPEAKGLFLWLKPLLPLMMITLVATAMMALLQSALPLDMVHGGLSRPALNASWSGGLIAMQLALLVVLQWPVGRWLADCSLRFGLGVSLVAFSVGGLLLGLSALWTEGIVLLVLALIAIAFAQAAFLPTATEAVIEETPPEHRGLGMALFSQCFAISAIAAPLAAGKLLDLHGNGVLVWIVMACLCLAMLPLLKAIKPRYDAAGPLNP
ncbi:MAG: MFS transporter, partial [Prochlorococcus sp.]